MIELKDISAQALSDTIGAIYDCALDPDRWQDAIQQIVELCESRGGGICVHDFKNDHNDRLFEFGYDPEFSKLQSARIADSPFMASAMIAEVGDVATLAMTNSDEEMIESRYYREVLKPFGYFDFIALIGLKTPGRFASLHASRTDAMPRYGEHEVRVFKLLSPHVCRALIISDALNIRTLRSDMLEATLNGLTAGVYLLSRDGRIVFMNATAERQTKTGIALRVIGNKLIPTDPNARAELSKMTAEMAIEEGEMVGSHSLPIPDPGGTGYVATLLPLERGQRQKVIAPFAAAVAIFVQEPAQAPIMPGKAFAKLYGLTGGELRVLLALAQGLGGKEAADVLGLSEATIRTHLQRIFSKTATSRQAEVLQLLQSSMPPIKVA